jgi:hypothetical protein
MLTFMADMTPCIACVVYILRIHKLSLITVADRCYTHMQCIHMCNAGDSSTTFNFDFGLTWDPKFIIRTVWKHTCYPKPNALLTLAWNCVHDSHVQQCTDT